MQAGGERVVDGSAMKATDLLALADAAETFARLARAATEGDDDPRGLVPLGNAARMAATSVRVVRDAIRSGELVAYGRQRDRAVRHEDLCRWIESRKVRAVGPADADIDRRIQRLGRKRETQAPCESMSSSCRPRFDQRWSQWRSATLAFERRQRRDLLLPVIGTPPRLVQTSAHPASRRDRDSPMPPPRTGSLECLRRADGTRYFRARIRLADDSRERIDVPEQYSRPAGGVSGRDRAEAPMSTRCRSERTRGASKARCSCG